MMAELPRSTCALLDLQGHRLPGSVLDVGSYLGTIARAIGCAYLHVDLTACEAAEEAGAPSILHSDTLVAGPYSTIFFDARDYDPGLAAELVGQAAERLAPGGLLVTTARQPEVMAAFATVEEQGDALVARAPLPSNYSPDWPTYDAEFNGVPYRFQAAPGVFSPRRLDEGTRFMLTQIQAKPGARFLDLGCGIGVVSRIASETWGCQVTAVDINARALRLTALNAPQAEVLASDGFRHLGSRQFDLIASNPPYHTDFAVAKAFIEGAYAHLTMGGTLYLVVKRADWYVQKIRHVFGGCAVAHAEGYTVIMAQKRERRPTEPALPTTTRKHARRLAQTKPKGRR